MNPSHNTTVGTAISSLIRLGAGARRVTQRNRSPRFGGARSTKSPTMNYLLPVQYFLQQSASTGPGDLSRVAGSLHPLSSSGISHEMLHNTREK